MNTTERIKSSIPSPLEERNLLKGSTNNILIKYFSLENIANPEISVMQNFISATKSFENNLILILLLELMRSNTKNITFYLPKSINEDSIKKIKSNLDEIILNFNDIFAKKFDSTLENINFIHNEDNCILIEKRDDIIFEAKLTDDIKNSFAPNFIEQSSPKYKLSSI